MCAFNSRTLQLAWIQINALQRHHGLSGESFTIYHADELNDGAAQAAVDVLHAMPNVHVESLRQWAESTYPLTDGNSTLQRLKGFLCKPAAVLASPHDTVAVLDLDAVFARNIWDILDEPIYRETGVYLFRDRRIRLPWDDVKQYRDSITALWQTLQPNGSVELPKAVTIGPIWRDWSHWVGESAFVVFDKTRLVRGMHMLERLMGTEYCQQAFHKTEYGDKEIYWKALAFAGEDFVMNPVGCTAAGLTQGGPENVRTCSYKYALTQWLPSHGDKETRIMYMNGDAIEDMLLEGEQTMLSAYVAKPLDYYDPDNFLDGSCGYEAHSLPLEMASALRTYYSIASDYPLGPILALQNRSAEV